MIGKVNKSTAIAVAAAATLLASAAGAADVDTIATGLRNPRALAFDTEGKLYVAESGLGAGDGHGGTAAGVGLTGAVSEIVHPGGAHPYPHRVVTGLASVDDPARDEVTGPDGIATRGDKMYVLEAASRAAVFKGLLGTSSSLSDAQLDAVEQFGKLLEVSPDEAESNGDEGGSRHFKTIAAVGDFDYAWTDNNQGAAFAPMGQFPDANPYAVLALPGHQYVVDAASNTIDEVRADGSIRIVAYVPNPKVSDAVPTCVAQGRDHKLYFGTLAFGANFALGQGGKNPQSKVYRFDPNATSSIQFLTEADVWASGFFPITGCGFGADGFYVTEFWTSLAPPGGGDVVRITINGDGSAGGRTHFGAGVLMMPNGFAAGPDGAIYVSNLSNSPKGTVVRIRP